MEGLITAISANPNQTITIPVQFLADGYNERVDAPDGYLPQIDSILLPNLQFAAGYPINMTKVATGLYIARITIPTGTSALGTYIISAVSINPNDGSEDWQIFMINVAAPFGTSFISPG